MENKEVIWQDICKRADYWNSFLRMLKPWRKIQKKDEDGNWLDVDFPNMHYLLYDTNEFRLIDKPLRPFKSLEEFKEHMMAAEFPDGTMPNVPLMPKAFDVEHNDKFYRKLYLLPLEIILQCPKDKETEMFHALYDNATDDEDCPFGVALEDGETFDSGEIPMTPVKTFGELKKGEYLHVLKYCDWLDSYYYNSHKIQKITNIGECDIEMDVRTSISYEMDHTVRMENEKDKSCYVNTEKVYDYGFSTHYIFTNYFELKRKFKELRNE